MRSFLRRSPPLLAALLLGGCADTFTPASVVEDLRVLAIVAEPPELRLSAAAGGNEVLTLRVTAVAPPVTPGGPPVTPVPADVQWTFCPFSVGASSGYACAIPACETVLEPDATGRSVSFTPLDRLLACLASVGGSLPGAPAGSGLPAQVEVLVRYVATLDGVQREAVQRIPVWTGTPPATQERNLNPIVSDFSAGAGCATGAAGCAVAAVPITVTIDPASFQPYPAGADRTVLEGVVVSFFTTAGRFKDERGQAIAGAAQTGVSLEARDLGGARQALVWAVARDLRGGEAVAGPLTVVFSKP
jgi:hypothetical protein